MEEFLPSEVARAVYGYLLGEGCEEAANTFLETSPNLTECKQRIKQGKRLTQANTLLLGKSLTDILNITYNTHSLLRQAYEKRQHNPTNGNDKEMWSDVFEELRSFLLSDSIANLSRSQTSENTSQQNVLTMEADNVSTQPMPLIMEQVPNTQQIPQSPNKSPVERRHSLADSYQSLVRECSDIFNVSISPVKPQQKSQDNEVLSNPVCRPTSAPGALVLPDLESENQSAITAITGMTFGEPQQSSLTQRTSTTFNQPQLIAISCNPTQLAPSINSCVPEIGATLSMSTTNVPQLSVPSGTEHCQPTNSATSPISTPVLTTLTSNISSINTICGLPDPPILVIGSQNQPIVDPSNSQSFFSIAPSATSTPQSTIMFRPEDTACIIYPSLTTDIRPSKKQAKKPAAKCTVTRPSKLRKLLPKPYRKDPPDIIHIKVLPQIIEEEDDSINSDLKSNTTLAVKLPKLNNVQNESRNVNKVVTNKNSKQLQHDTEKRSKSMANDKASDNLAVVESAKGEPAGGTVFSSNNNSNTDTNTPKRKLKKNISRSTPSRKNSHIRALSFNTPNKPIETRKFNTSPKTPRIRFSPRSSKLNNVKRSSLFKSPSEGSNKELPCLIEENEQSVHSGYVESNEILIDELSLSKVPIATISPAEKLSSAWKEVNDVTFTEKPQWDDKIRSFICGDFVDPAPPPKKENKRKLKANSQVKKKSPKKKKNKVLPERRSSRLNTKQRSRSQSPIMEVIKENNSLEIKGKRKNVKKVKSKPCSEEENKVQVNEVPETINAELCSGSNFLNEDLSSSNNENTIDINSSDCKSNNHNNGNCSLSNSCIEINKTESNSPIIDKKESIKIDNFNTKSNNILFDDLLLSSNSCFPQANDGAENHTTAIRPQDSEHVLETTISTAHDSETIKTSERQSQENVSKFVLPVVPVMATPLKEFQLIPPQNSLITPLLKTIRQETSVLEEDLLLTPSLPPTPIIRSPNKTAITPFKQITNSSAIQVTSNDAEMNLSENELLHNEEANDYLKNKEKHTNNISSCTNDRTVNKEKENKIILNEPPHISDYKINKNNITNDKCSSKESIYSVNVNTENENKNELSIENIKHNKNPNSNVSTKQKDADNDSCNISDNEIVKDSTSNTDDELKGQEKVINIQEKNELSVEENLKNKEDMKTNTPIKEVPTNKEKLINSSNHEIVMVKESNTDTCQATIKKDLKRSSNKSKLSSCSSTSDSSDTENNEIDTYITKFSKSVHTDSYNSICSSADSSEEQIQNLSDTIKVSPTKSNPKIRVRVIQGLEPSTKNLKKNCTAVDPRAKDNEVKPVPAVDCQNKNEAKKGLSSLASLILEDERRKLDCQSNKFEKTVKKRSQLKKDIRPKMKKVGSHHLQGAGGIITNVNKTRTKKKKEHKKEKRKSKQNDKCSLSKSIKKSSDTKDITGQSISPEKIQLQLDLLRKERQQIFGDSFPSSSDSEIDLDIFEEKKNYPKKKKFAKAEIKKETVKQSNIHDESSLDDILENNKREELNEKITLQNNQFNNSGDKFQTTHGEEEKVKNSKIVNFSTSDPNLNKSTITSKIQGLEEDSVQSDSLSPDKNQFVHSSKTKEMQNAEIPDKPDCIDGGDKHSSLIDANSFADVSSSMDTNNTIENKLEECSISSSSVKCNTSFPRPPTPFKVSSSEQIAEVIDDRLFMGESNNESENHVVVISTTTTSRTDKSACVSGLDPDYKLGFEVDDNKISTICFSDPIIHLTLPSRNKASVKTSLKEISREEIIFDSKDQLRKKRITLTPVGDDKYEQKLKVDYDVIDGKVISKRGERHLSVDMDTLECTCSTIVDGEVSSSGEVTLRKDQTFNLASTNQITNLSDNIEENTKPVKNKLEGLNVIKETHNIENNFCSIKSRGSLPMTNLKQMVYDKNEQLEVESNRSPNLGDVRDDTDKPLLRVSVSGGNYKGKSRFHPFENRNNYEDKERRYRSHRKYNDRRHEDDRYSPRYSDKRRIDTYQRGYSERRYHQIPDRYYKRSNSPNFRGRNYDSPKYYMKKSYDNENRSTRKPKDDKVLLAKKVNFRYNDLDNVKEKVTRKSSDNINKDIILDQQKLDPRVSNLVVYSDIEKNESSCDANSLMDFAVLRKPNDSKASLLLSQTSPGKTSSSQTPSSQSLKRKHSFSEENKIESNQESKRLKLDEVDIKEAKSVLKHKMTDMLNALHPDTSNQDS